MKRILLAAGCLAFVVACSQAQTAQPAKLSGARSMALVGDLILVASTERNELRVLDLLPPVTIQGRQFLPAPNPLQALSIPVLDRPTRLGRDLSYASLEGADGTVIQADGLEVGGPYVYASSPGTAALSIVGATEDLLVHVARLPTAAPVTATAGSFDAVKKTSVLYFATDDGEEAAVHQLPLPAPNVLNDRRKADESASTALLLSERTTVTRRNGVSVADLLPLPGGRLVVAFRDRHGIGGKTVVIDLATNVETVMDFGAPIRSLQTHPATKLSDGTVLAAGARLYGLLDEGACGGPACGGVVAVDSRTGARVVDFTGSPMQPLRFGEVLPIGLAILANAPLNVPGAGLITVPLLGVLTNSVGETVFFDAGALSQYDVDTSTARVTEPLAMYAPGADAGALGPVLPYVAGPDPATLSVTEALIQDEEIFVTEGGLLVDGISVVLDGAGGATFGVTADNAARLRVADRVELNAGTATCTATLATLAGTTATLTSACPAGAYTARIFAGRASEPFVVTGSRTGFMGRVAVGATFVFAGTPGRAGAVGPALTFTMGMAAADTVAGNIWRFKVASGFAPRYSTYIDTSNTYSAVSTCAVHLPGPIAMWLPGQKGAVNDSERNAVRLFVAYPSANGVMEMVPALLNPGPASANVFCYR